MESFPYTSPEDTERLVLELHSLLTLAQFSRRDRLTSVGNTLAAH
jgi:hypothetical protein